MYELRTEKHLVQIKKTRAGWMVTTSNKYESGRRVLYKTEQLWSVGGYSADPLEEDEHGRPLVSLLLRYVEPGRTLSYGRELVS